MSTDTKPVNRAMSRVIICLESQPDIVLVIEKLPPNLRHALLELDGARILIQSVWKLRTGVEQANISGTNLSIENFVRILKNMRFMDTVYNAFIVGDNNTIFPIEIAEIDGVCGVPLRVLDTDVFCHWFFPTRAFEYDIMIFDVPRMCLT